MPRWRSNFAAEFFIVDFLASYYTMVHKFLTAAEFFKNAAKRVYLYKNVWRENSTALLHAPRETDKTATAIDIACDLARKGRETVYVACERRIEDYAARLANAPQKLSVCIPAFESPDDKTDYADLVISTIEEIIGTTEIRTFVIDSVTRIAALSFGRNASAAYVMKRLAALQVRCKLSLLVLSHDTTKSVDRALLTLADCEITVEVEEDDATVVEESADRKPAHFRASARADAISRTRERMSASGA